MIWAHQTSVQIDIQKACFSLNSTEYEISESKWFEYNDKFVQRSFCFF